MFSQLMGNYLVEKGVLSKGVLDGINAKQNAARVKLGTIAVSEKMLTQTQADEINHLQTQMDMRFGDIAVDKGYLSANQVTELLSKQGSPYMKFIQLLTEDAGLSMADIEVQMEAFQKEKGFNDAEMLALKQDDIDAIVPVFAYASKPYVTDLVGLVLRNITRFISTDYCIGRIKHINSISYSFMAGQKVVGDHDITLGFIAEGNPGGICEIASKFGIMDHDEINGEVADAVGEFANISNGLLASDLSEKGVDIDMLPPFAYINQTAEGSAYVVPVYIGDKEIKIYIAVDSEISVGKIPYVYSSIETQSNGSTEGSKGTVVIVDDSAMIRKMLRAILEEAGYSVVAEAKNGLEAVVAYKQYNPDVISLDITMPEKDGIEALREIMEYDKNAYAIMVTAAGQQQKVITALKLGAAKFIMKPFIKDEVVKGFEK